MPPLVPGWDTAVGPYLLLRTGSCTNHVTTKADCEDAATRLGLTQTSAILANPSGERYPPFCFVTAGYLYFEPTGQNSGSCASGLNSRCLCLQSPPTPPPLPPAPPPQPPHAPGVAAVSSSFILLSQGSCEANVQNADACTGAAATLGVSLGARFFSSAASPPACFIYRGELWFNRDGGSTRPCTSSMRCVCLPGPPAPPAPPHPRPPPPLPPQAPPYAPGLQRTVGSYELRSDGSCSLGISAQLMCEGAAFALGLGPANINATAAQPADLLGGQPYCFFAIASGILFFNANATDAGRCHMSHRCLCISAPSPPPTLPPSPPSIEPPSVESGSGWQSELNLVATTGNVSEALTGGEGSSSTTASAGVIRAREQIQMVSLVVITILLLCAVAIVVARKARVLMPEMPTKREVLGVRKGSARAKAARTTSKDAGVSLEAEAVDARLDQQQLNELHVTFSVDVETRAL